MKNKNQKEDWEKGGIAESLTTEDRIAIILEGHGLENIEKAEMKMQIRYFLKSEREKLLEKIDEIIDDNNDLLRWQKEELKDEIKKGR